METKLDNTPTRLTDVVTRAATDPTAPPMTDIHKKNYRQAATSQNTRKANKTSATLSKPVACCPPPPMPSSNI